MMNAPLLLALVLSQAAQPTPTLTWSAARFVDAARKLLGVPYEFGGRMRGASLTIDCQGVLFYAAERVGACGWKSFSVLPTESVRDGELGAPVPGLAPIAASELDVQLLLPGDVLLFVDPVENPGEKFIAQLGGRAVWVWHTGIYSGHGRFIVGDHFAGQVVELELLPYLREHYAGLFVTRMRAGPMPKRCRTHAPMKSPAAD